MRISDYGYSYANRIGTALRYPLYKVSDNTIAIIQNWHTDSRLVRIVKVAMRCLITAVCIVPASLLWLLGKGICKLGKTQIKREGLALGPLMFSGEQERLLKYVQDYKEKLILEICQPIFDRLFIQMPGFQDDLLNSYRMNLGHELGLKSPTGKRLKEGKIATAYFKWVFIEKFENVNRLISEVQSVMKNDRVVLFYNGLLNDFLPLPDHENNEFRVKHFYTNEENIVALSEPAINFLLKTMGVLK